MHPEIHTEMKFGYEHSIDITSVQILNQLGVFGEHEQEWQEVDVDIVTDREQYERVEAPGSAELQRSVEHEVAACDAHWLAAWGLGLVPCTSVRSGRATGALQLGPRTCYLEPRRR
jgi:hypothetical protein